MRRITFYLTWLFIFSLPLDRLSLPAVGRVTNMFGALTIGVGVLSAATSGRLRKPGAILWLAFAFALSALLTAFWSVSAVDTLERAFTYAQLAAIVWIVWEFARTKEDQQQLLLAYCLGMFVPVFYLLDNFVAGVRIDHYEARFSASGYNANDIGLMCALMIPIAWRLVMNCGGVVRIIAAIGFLLAPVGMLLTGNRGSFLASIVALSLVPLTLPRTRRSLYAVGLVILVVATIAIVVPALSWNRVLSTPQELREGGDFGGRLAIWAAGFRVFEGRPLLGVGAGNFELAIYPVLGNYQGAHNTLLAVLVEQGIAGFSVFAALLGACWWIIREMPGPERKFWAVLMLSWFVGGLSIHWQYHKLTWLLFGLLAAQGGLPTGRRAATQSLSSEELYASHGALPQRM